MKLRNFSDAHLDLQGVKLKARARIGGGHNTLLLANAVFSFKNLFAVFAQSAAALHFTFLHIIHILSFILQYLS